MAVRQFAQGSAGRTEGGCTFYYLLQFGHWKCNRAERQRAWSQHLITGLSYQEGYDTGNYDYRHKRKEKFGSLAMEATDDWLMADVLLGHPSTRLTRLYIVIGLLTEHNVVYTACRCKSPPQIILTAPSVMQETNVPRVTFDWCV